MKRSVLIRQSVPGPASWAILGELGMDKDRALGMGRGRRTHDHYCKGRH